MASDLLPQDVCVQVDAGTQLCVTFPGGVTICAQTGLDTGDVTATTRALSAQLNTALAPFAPILLTIEAVVALMNAVKAIPEAIGVPPDPTKLAEAIPKAIEAVAKVAGIPAGVLATMKGILLAIIESVRALLGELSAIATAQAGLAEIEELSMLPGNEVLRAVFECETANLATDIANQNASMQPINQILALVSSVLEPLIGKGVPGFADITDASAETLETIASVLDVIAAVVSLLPG